ncbi:MAG: hypothetical protein HY791_09985 [Deltaproteobacteria bacterium]|nr:hypothetical protein [Deltaproteobacteria bacterium]
MKVTSNGLDPRFHEIPCPVLRTLVKEQAISVGPEGQVDLAQLQKALRGIGVSDLVSKILAHGGSDASPVRPELLRDSGRKELDIYRLRGSSLDHLGDTRILRDPSVPFSQERLDALLSLSTDGKTLTTKDLALANKLNVGTEGGSFRAVGIGLAELGALLLVFGRRNQDGVKALQKDDIVALYRDSKLPDGFEAGNVGLMDVVGTIAKMAFQRTFSVGGRAMAGLEAATGKPRMLNESGVEGLKRGLCPAGMRPDVSAAVSARDIEELHQPVQTRS